MSDPQLLDRLRELWNRPPELATEAEHCDDFAEKPENPPKPLPWCPRYAHPKAWRSIFGEHLICATCHPPVVDSVVAEWIDESETGDT